VLDAIARQRKSSTSSTLSPSIEEDKCS
jgi:hypothetical protein